MFRRYRFVLRPGWLVFHVIVAAAVVGMILLGRWQLHVSESKHFSIQNFGYSLQWWAFSGFAVLLWLRLIRDAQRRDNTLQSQESAAIASSITESVPYRRYVMPTTSATDDDPVRAAYNDYLAGLAAEDAEDADNAATVTGERSKNRR